MKKHLITTILFCFTSFLLFAQNNSLTITGKVTNEKNEPLSKASVTVKNGTIGAVSDNLGKFRLTVTSLPVTIIVSFSGYEPEEMTIKSAAEVSIILQTNEKLLDAVVISGDRVERRLTNSAVSIERVGKADIINSPTDPYGLLLTRKNLDVTLSSMTYRTFSTRGFNGSGTSRVNQLMDGMDNQAPGLNFAVGNFIGLTDLDIESIEILPGASSALYGPGGVNGTIILNAKNPFKYPGLSIQVKNGITDIGKDQRGKSGGLIDYSLRWAKSFNNKFAIKIGVQYLRANDWLANDTTNYLRIGSVGNVKPGSRYTDPNYDGINVYGDETSVDVRQFVGAIAGFYPPGSPQQNAILALYGNMTNPTLVSRTGYKEIDVFDPKTKNLKLSGALHYKFTDKIEGILAGHWGTGNTIYSGNTRYGLKDIQVGQYKAELRHKNWFLRGYTTQEDAGEAYGATVTTQLLNEGWKPSYNPANPLGSWYIQYAQAYIQTRLAGGNDLMAHSNARGFADIGRPAEGSARYTQLFDSVRSIPIPKGGRFVEKSQLWMGEGQYNFSDKVKFAEIIAGGNAKKYVLNSSGTLFIDTAGPIKINEWGAYSQITKKLLNDKLVLSAAGRYDKNENFSGKFTPRFTALINIANSHNIRLSYQTAYKFPTTQQQWIKLDIGSVVLLGGLPWILNVVQPEKFATYIFNNNQLSPYTYKRLKPESMRSFEVGYKGLVDKKLLIDVYAYFGRYTDITGRILLVQPSRNTKPWSVVANSDTKVKAWGAGAGFDYKMAKNYFSFLNAYTDNLTNVPTGFQVGFNTPKYRINTGFGNSGLGKKERIGFNVVLRWQDEFFWEGAGFVDGTVKAYTTLDAQVNYKLPKIKSLIKIGGTNITNNFYQTGFGNPYIGGMYYVSFTYNIL